MDGWISVEDRMPPARKIVVLAAEYGSGTPGTKWVSVGHRDGDGFWHWADDSDPIGSGTRISHWMPLPEHPNA